MLLTPFENLHQRMALPACHGIHATVKFHPSARPRNRRQTVAVWALARVRDKRPSVIDLVVWQDGDSLAVLPFLLAKQGAQDIDCLVALFRP
jgi:hypothetical protein